MDSKIIAQTHCSQLFFHEDQYLLDMAHIGICFIAIASDLVVRTSSLRCYFKLIIGRHWAPKGGGGV